jgi:nucleoside-diphosphate-sugar epimerase
LTERIAVLGANGVYARHLIPRLVAAGYGVRALVRRPEAAGVARACGAEIATADIFDVGSLTVALAGCDIGVNLATSLPGPAGRGSFDANDRGRSEGTANWVSACGQAGVNRVVQQSIGMVNARGPEWSDEESVADDSGDSVAAKAIRAALVMEELITASALDMAAATVAALGRWPARTRLIVCDDAPSQWRDVFGYVAALAGQGTLGEGGRAGFPSFRLKNKRARETLAWAPMYPSFREGLSR